MDPNKFYYRNAAQPTASTSVAAAPLSAPDCAAGGSSMQEYVGCGSAQSSAVFSCKELMSRNANSKAQFNNRGTNVVSGFGVGGGGATNTGSYCSSNSSATGNYINVMPVAMGTLQYHRRKLTPQEYQSRLYYNTTDYRCRDDYYAMGGAGGGSRVHSSSPSPSLQLQNQHQQHQQQNQHHQQHQHQQQHHHQSSQQTGANYHQQQTHYHQHQQHQHQTISHLQNMSLPHQLPHQHHQTTCNNPNPALDCTDETLNCNLIATAGNGRVVAAATQTQMHHNSSNATVCEKSFVGPAPISMPGSVPGPPMMYTVHRVVTTAQIQTGVAGNSFASSSSVSSVVSAVRNEAECLAASAATTSSNGCHAGGSAVGIGGVSILGDAGGNSVLNSNTLPGNLGTVAGMRNAPGLGTNSNYLPHATNCNGTSDIQQHSASRLASSNYNSTTSSSNAGYISGAKSSSSIPRPLQNVIPTCVYLMSRVAVHMEIEGTAQCPTQVMLAAALGCEELGIANKLLAQSIFGLWMTSTLLEIQLKSHHRPYVVRVAWSRLLEKFSHSNPIEKKFDEPMIMLKRNVFFSKRDEEKIKDHRILELLYEEAKQNVLSGRYVMEPVHSLMLGGIQARIELGPYNSHTHAISFFRENQSRFLPQHVAKSSTWSWLPVSRKSSAEVRLLEQFKRVPQTATTRKLMRKYLEFCWALPFYGAAFFHGQVEQPVRGLMSFVNHKDVEVIVAINERGVYIIDPIECTLLLGLRYEDLSWDFAKPSSSDDPECKTCIFIQFDAVENGIQISKLMQIFSKQAAMIDALISHFADQMRKRKQDGNASEQFHDEPNPIQNNGNGVLCNKLSRLTLATFDEEGRCIGQMGSLSISY